MQDILFTPENHRLILALRKTKTRRLARLSKPLLKSFENGIMPRVIQRVSAEDTVTRQCPSWCPWEPQGFLYVKEGIGFDEHDDRHFYRLDNQPCPDGVAQLLRKRGRLAPYDALFMPAVAARTILHVLKIGLGRLHDIDDLECLNEGVLTVDTPEGRFYSHPDKPQAHYDSPVDCFRSLWESIHGTGAWDANPPVFDLTFELHPSSRPAATEWLRTLKPQPEARDFTTKR